MSEDVDRAVAALERLADAAERIAVALEPDIEVVQRTDYFSNLLTGGAVVDDRPIEMLDIGVRAYNCLKRSGANTVGDVASATSSTLLAIPNLGEATLQEIKVALMHLGLQPPPAGRAD